MTRADADSGLHGDPGDPCGARGGRSAHRHDRRVRHDQPGRGGGAADRLACCSCSPRSATRRRPDQWFAGWGRRAGADTVAVMLRSPSPQVRLATAEAVLGPEAHTVRRYTSAELRELALDVLLNRDLVRRLADLLRRGGYTVTAADSVDATLGDPAANVVVRVDRPGGTVQMPITVSNDSQPDVPRVVAMLEHRRRTVRHPQCGGDLHRPARRRGPAEQHHARSVRSGSSPSSHRDWATSSQFWRRWPRPSRSSARFGPASIAAPSCRRRRPAASTNGRRHQRRDGDLGRAGEEQHPG